MVNSMMLAEIFGAVDKWWKLEWWQFVLIALLIVIIVFYVMYRRKQM